MILAPTVTIKNQWIQRFISSFTNFTDVPEWISTNIYNLKFFNVVTYQALHYAFKKQKIRSQKSEDTDEIEEKEEGIEDLEKIKSYNLIEEIKKNNDKCLETMIVSPIPLLVEEDILIRE